MPCKLAYEFPAQRLPRVGLRAYDLREDSAAE